MLTFCFCGYVAAVVTRTMIIPTPVGAPASPLPTLLPTELVPQCPAGTAKVITNHMSANHKKKMETNNHYNGTLLDNHDNNFVLYTGG